MFQEKYGVGSGACLGLPAPRRSELGEFSEVRGGDAEVVGGVGESSVLLMVTTFLQTPPEAPKRRPSKNQTRKKKNNAYP
jgi:hypothetical protein